MSAFIVSHAHIDALLTFANEQGMREAIGESLYSNLLSTNRDPSWTEIGKVLLRENTRSVLHRYPDCTEGDAPGTEGETVDNYTFTPFLQFDAVRHHEAVWVLKACDCFDYQACETDDYYETVARKIIQAIRNRAISEVPGYDNAPWTIHRSSPKRSPHMHFDPDNTYAKRAGRALRRKPKAPVKYGRLIHPGGRSVKSKPRTSNGSIGFPGRAKCDCAPKQKTTRRRPSARGCRMEAYRRRGLLLNATKRINADP